MESCRILISNLQATKTKIHTTTKNKSESKDVMKSQNSWVTIGWLSNSIEVLVFRDHLNWYCQNTLLVVTDDPFIFCEKFENQFQKFILYCKRFFSFNFCIEFESYLNFHAKNYQIDFYYCELKISVVYFWRENSRPFYFTHLIFKHWITEESTSRASLS